MNVTIDPHSGFCFGVVHAIEIAERELSKDERLFCLGDIVHNHMEVNRLKDLGMITIGRDEFQHLKNCKVLIRAHGEPPETYRIALQNNIKLIDASCPIVLHLQKDILKGFGEMQKKNGQVVIYGKEGHAEVIGLIGQTHGKAIVIRNENDLDRIDFSRPVRIYSQTTMSMEGFQKVVKIIQDRVKKANQNGDPDFIWNDSICRHVSNRSRKLKEFVKQFEVILFVSDKKSSNGMFLYDVCKKINHRTFLLSGKEELQKKWFRGTENVGICGATSTPKWLMEEIRNEVIIIND